MGAAEDWAARRLSLRTHAASSCHALIVAYRVSTEGIGTLAWHPRLWTALLPGKRWFRVKMETYHPEKTQRNGHISPAKPGVKSGDAVERHHGSGAQLATPMGMRARRRAGGTQPLGAGRSRSLDRPLPPASSHHEGRHHRHTLLEAEPHACAHRQWLPGGMLRQELGQCLGERLRLFEVRQACGRGENHPRTAILLDRERR